MTGGDAVSRFALYFIPERGGPLHNLGSALLGRDLYTGKHLPHPAIPGLSPERVHELTADARRYGLHATVKPPFHLAPGFGPEDVIYRLREFCRGRTVPDLPRLGLARTGNWYALMPSRDTPEERRALEALESMAEEAVRAFDIFRAPPVEAELARRRKAGLSPRQESCLQRWGYPYLFGDYQFHMTLTGSVRDAPEAACLETFFTEYFRPVLTRATRIAGLTVCVQKDQGGEFLASRQEPFTRGRSASAPLSSALGKSTNVPTPLATRRKTCGTRYILLKATE
jgi:hypothetical protein